MSETRTRKLTLRERQEIVASMSWVTRLKNPRSCDGYMHNTATKHIHGTPEQRAQRPRCKRPARWRFKSLKRSWVPDGTYCWSHLLYGCLYGDMDEDARTRRWLKRHGYV